MAQPRHGIERVVRLVRVIRRPLRTVGQHGVEITPFWRVRPNQTPHRHPMLVELQDLEEHILAVEASVRLIERVFDRRIEDSASHLANSSGHRTTSKCQIRRRPSTQSIPIAPIATSRRAPYPTAAYLGATSSVE